MAREGLWEMVLATLVLGGGAVLAALWHLAAALPLVVVWAWVISFFRDPRRVTRCGEGEFCAPADGTITEVSRLDHDARIDGPALRIGIFLSIFNVHINRSPCAGVVRSVAYRKGSFHDARDPRSGPENEANTLVIEPQPPMGGPVIVRQVAGLVARRIICRAAAGTELSAGQRFGLIKFGSRTELIVPDDGKVQPAVKVGDRARAGLTIVVRQAPLSAQGESDAGSRQAQEVAPSASA